MKGIVTDIQRFSLSDGPGIRTTVFFKGCNMRCAWCHNPETINPKQEIMYTQSNCIGCLKCVCACRTGAQTDLGGMHAFIREKCVNCGRCAEICYPEAMAVSGKTMTVDDVMREIAQDRIYYDRSGGGVTLSGGEATCQAEFALALMRACRDEGIQVGLESNLLAPYKDLEPLFEYTDILMADIKLMDDGGHREWVGVGNARVLENMRRAGDGSRSRMIVRTPLIPGVTDSDDNIRQIAAFVSGLKDIMYYELLNFNPLGDGKYRGLGMENRFASARPLNAERLKRLKQIAEESGVPTRIG